MKNKDAIEVLSELVKVSNDGAEGFSDAADLADDPQLKTLFYERAQQCSEAVDELRGCIAELGGVPPDGGTMAGAAHRNWQKVRAALSDSNKAALEEIERGEDHAKAVYLNAVKAELPPTIKSIVARQCHGVQKNHDRIRDLRDTYRQQAA